MSDVAYWHEPSWKVHKDAYQGRCPCGWRGEVRTGWLDARMDLDVHRVGCKAEQSDTSEVSESDERQGGADA